MAKGRASSSNSRRLNVRGLTPKYNSGLESKLPSVGMSVAEAKETNPQGYEVPKLINGSIKSGKFVEDGVTIILELYDTADGGRAGRYRVGDKVFAYDIDDDKDVPIDYHICDSDGDGIFESKYNKGEDYKLPDWVKS